MKIIELIEARRNPIVNNARNGPENVIAYLKTLSPEVLRRTFVSGQDINKLSPNFVDPLMRNKSDNYKHVAGIYAWPAWLYVKGHMSTGDIGYLRKHMYVFELNQNRMLRSDDPKFRNIMTRAFSNGTPVDLKYKSNKVLRDLGYESIYAISDETTSDFVEIDAGAVCVLSSKFCHNIKAFPNQPEHVELEPESDRAPYTWRGSEKLLNLAKTKPLTAQQEQVIVDSEEEAAYLRLLVKLKRPPTNRKIADNFIMKYIWQLAHDVNRAGKGNRATERFYSTILSFAALVHPNPKQFIDSLVNEILQSEYNNTDQD